MIEIPPELAAMLASLSTDAIKGFAKRILQRYSTEEKKALGALLATVQIRDDRLRTYGVKRSHIDTLIGDGLVDIKEQGFLNGERILFYRLTPLGLHTARAQQEQEE